MPAKILVLSASVGAGHLRAAQAVELALKELAPQGTEVRNVDVLTLTNTAFRKLYGEAYLDLVNKAPHVLGFFYDLMDRPKKANSKRDRLRLALETVNLRKFCDLMECERWDVVVNTHFLPPEIIRSLKKQNRLALPQVTVVTDFDAHALWVNDPLDQYCCATGEAAAYIHTLGVPEDRITITGIPIHPVFSKPRDADDARKAHGLNGDRPVVLQLAGGFGVGPIEKLTRAILSIEQPLDVVVVAGRNEKLKAQLDKVDAPARHRLKVMGFTDKMDELMAAADVVVSKPGGLTTSEVLARGAAMAIVNPIPGQETRNSDFLLENGAAIKINTAATLPHKLGALLADSKRLETLKRNARRVAKPQAAFDVARLALRHVGVACLLLTFLLGAGCAKQYVDPSEIATRRGPQPPRLVNIDPGPDYRANVGGACTVTPNGTVLLVTHGPESVTEGRMELTRTEMWSSRDSGKTWDGPRVLHQGTREHIMLPISMLTLSSGKVLLLCALYGGYDLETHDPEKSKLDFYTQTSSDNGKTWSQPARINLPGWNYVNAPLSILQLKSGRILIPSGYLTPRSGSSVVSALYSDDQGKTWTPSKTVLDTGGEGFESGAAEPTAVELPDGRVWMLMRTQTGVQWESYSTDGGTTWSKPQPSRFTSSSAPAVFTRLRDGRIVVVWNNSVATPYARHSLVAAISSDGGKSFHGYREIAKVEYPLTALDKRWGVAYAYPQQAPDGTLLVPFNTGDWQKMKLRVARVDPNWIGQSFVYDHFDNGLGAWCDVGTPGGLTLSRTLTGPVNDLKPTGEGMELSVGWSAPGPTGATRNVPLVRTGEITFTVVPRQGPSYLLLHNSFLAPGKFDEAVLRIRFDPEQGTAHVAAGQPTERKIAAKKFEPVYAYTAYPVPDGGASYPARIEPNQPCKVTIRIDAGGAAGGAGGTAKVRINNGPEVEHKLAPPAIEGICYVGVAVGENGKMRLQRVTSRDDAPHELRELKARPTLEWAPPAPAQIMR